MWIVTKQDRARLTPAFVAGNNIHISIGQFNLSKRNLAYSKGFFNTFAVRLLKTYGFLSRPFDYKWLAWIGVFVGRYVKPDEVCVVSLSEGSQFQFYLADYYWSKLVCNGFSYEPEIERVLSSIKDEDYLFLDLGANYGYWSVMVSSERFGEKNCIAIEPVKKNFQMLSSNNKLNDNRFTAMRSAVSDQPGQTIEIFSNPDSLANEGASMNQDAYVNLIHSESVQSVSIDQLVKQFAGSSQSIVIKLDVEGAEVTALHGAIDTLQRNHLFMYEDHGNDPDSKVSDYILSQGLSVFSLENGIFSQIQSLQQVKSLKIMPNKGYNLFACRKDSGFEQLLIKHLAT